MTLPKPGGVAGMGAGFGPASAPGSASGAGADADAAATFCATLVDEWRRHGVSHGVICPGSRSTPMAVALLLADRPRLSITVRLDERGAAFFALGMALQSGRPAILLTTSGTAAAEVHAAVVEAHYARVPLIVCTADRPPELRQVGAPQAIDQSGLFGRHVRFFADPGVPDWKVAGTWRSLGSRSVLEALAGPYGPGPVHLNLPFREPLMARAADLPSPRPGGRPWHGVTRPRAVDQGAIARLSDELRPERRGLIVAGGTWGASGASG
ncbi:MAG: thiamine pyrophosphate-binding protein, partial [Acidimicrobiales bacterium]